MISLDDLQQIELVTFNGAISYNEQGYAVLPSYTITNILASVQALTSSGLKFLPEGTHNSDYINILTDEIINVDNNNSLGNYFIWNNLVYKIVSCQNYQNFLNYSTNHISSIVSQDNRLLYDGTNISLPFPQIDDIYAPLFELVHFAKSATNNLTTLWGFQEELRPNFPYCVINILDVRDMENTNYEAYNYEEKVQYTSRSTVLRVSFRFYTYDKIQAHSIMQSFKLKSLNYNFSSPRFAYLGLDTESSLLSQELYENRTIFHSDTVINFSLIVEDLEISTMSIDTVTSTLSYRN